MSRLTLAAFFLLFTAPAFTAQMAFRSSGGQATVPSIYSGVPSAWIEPLSQLARNGRDVPLMLKGNLQTPGVRAQLAPMVMAMEAKGITPANFPISPIAQRELLSAAMSSARDIVSQEAKVAISRATIGRGKATDLAEVSANLYMLDHTLKTYLPDEEKPVVRATYELARGQLSGAQQAKFQALIGRIAQGLDSGKPGQEEAVLAGPTDGNSFARKLAQLQPSAQRPASQKGFAAEKELAAIAKRISDVERTAPELPDYVNDLVASALDGKVGRYGPRNLWDRLTGNKSMSDFFFRVNFEFDGEAAHEVPGYQAAYLEKMTMPDTRQRRWAVRLVLSPEADAGAVVQALKKYEHAGVPILAFMGDGFGAAQDLLYYSDGEGKAVRGGRYEPDALLRASRWLSRRRDTFLPY